MERRNILKNLEEAIYDCMGRCFARNYRITKNAPAVNPHKIRQGYYNNLASLINAYARLSKDVEIDELMEEFEKLREELYG